MLHGRDACRSYGVALQNSRLTTPPTLRRGGTAETPGERLDGRGDEEPTRHHKSHAKTDVECEWLERTDRLHRPEEQRHAGTR